MCVQGRRGSEIEPLRNSAESSLYSRSLRSGGRHGKNELFVEESSLYHSSSATEIRRSSLIKERAEYRKESSRLALDDTIASNY